MTKIYKIAPQPEGLQEGITLAPQPIAAGAPSKEELALISAYTTRAHAPEELYTFSVRLCDNEIDRDGEAFTPETLRELAALYVGKSGIFDHAWSAQNQQARIYRTEIVTENAKTEQNTPLCWLKASAYMLREGNADAIRAIEAGIRKEVSVGCAVRRKICSVCGKKPGNCGHKRGEKYDNTLCYTLLDGAADAYEWSFVAVPAQPAAGIVKNFELEGGVKMKTLKDMAMAAGGDAFAEYERLETLAAEGETRINGLRSEVSRLFIAASGFAAETAEKLAAALGEAELKAAKTSLETAARDNWPAAPQILNAEEVDEGFKI